jgi:serine/threonine-protein kinase RsbW
VETVSIRIPASPEYLHVVRLVTSGLAARVGFTLDDIEDLKIGVDELAAYLTGPQGRDGALEIRFSVGDDHIEIHGAARVGTPQAMRTDLTEMSRMILETVADSAVLTEDDLGPCFRLVKRRGA